jgi:phage/plasmid-like protein (TIGR03299 family)
VSDPKGKITIMTITTDVPRDVNEEFRQERVGQIAAAYRQRDEAAARFADRAARFDARVEAGELRDNGNGTYTSLTGYDRGEVWNVQRQPGQIPLIIPQTGLDEVDGKAQLYSAVPMWAEVGNIIPGGTTDIEQVLELGGINWLVDQAPVRYYHKGKLQEVPGAFVNKRSDTGDPLGVVGKIYTPLQPAAQLGFLQDLAERYDIPFESAGPLNGGKQVFVSMKVPESIRIDAEGVNDTVQLFFAAINSNDGQGKNRVVASPWRPVCGNTNRFALRDAVTSWGFRHTESMPKRIAEAQRQLGLVFKYGETFQAEETQLAQTAVTLGQVEQLVAEIWGNLEEGASDLQKRRHEERLDKVFERFGLETSRVGRTAYAAENAITGHLDHEATRRGTNMAAARATANLLGADDDKKAQAHKLLLTLAA